MALLTFVRLLISYLGRRYMLDYAFDDNEKVLLAAPTLPIISKYLICIWILSCLFRINELSNLHHSAVRPLTKIVLPDFLGFSIPKLYK